MKYLAVAIILLLSLLVFFISILDLRIKQFRTVEEANGSEFHTVHFIGLIEGHGYQAEWHNVTTDDGYILSLFRILPNQMYHNVSEKRRIIYLQHSLASSTDVYVLFGPGRSLPYVLSDAGYDVWLGNFRGNTYSRRHRELSPDDSAFWNFSLEEYALSDTPAMLNYILKMRNQSTLTYIGYSLGTTTILILLSIKPEYNDKFDTVVLLAPITYWKTQSPTRSFMSGLIHHSQLLSPSGAVELQSSFIIPLFFKYICLYYDCMRDSCNYPYYAIVAKNFNHRRLDEFPRILSYYPSGVSAKVFYHYTQHVRSGRFHRYEYGNKELNYEHYGEEYSPEYNLTNIRTPLVIFRGRNDALSTEEDIETLINKLPKSNQIIFETVHHEQFHHADFVFYENAEKLVYTRLLEIIEKFHSCENFRLS